MVNIKREIENRETKRLKNIKAVRQIVKRHKDIKTDRLEIDRDRLEREGGVGNRETKSDRREKKRQTGCK